MFHKVFMRVFAATVAFVLLLGSFYVTAESSDGIITISTVKAITGDSVIVRFDIENNPGIMAMTLSITYDSSALTYEKYYPGFFRDYTVADHPDKNLIRMVNCEIKDRANNAMMYSLQFKVKPNAEFDFHKISIDYKAGDFCNWDLKKLMPKIVPGGIDVAYNGNNCSHKSYSDWSVAAEPSCEKPGAKQRTCAKCGHVDIAEIPAVGHDFEDKWTVDKQATKDQQGRMSRHCKRCDEVTDILTFSLEESNENNFQNSEGAVIAPSKPIEQMMQTQHPEVTSDKQTGSDSDSTSSGSNTGNSSSASASDGTGSEINSETGSDSKTDSAIKDFVNSVISAAEKSDNPNMGRLAKILTAIPNLKTVGIVILTFISVILRLLVL